jgi:oxygen-dependent protoporphyrinogen oxidase
VKRVVVVGAGMTGLACAWFLRGTSADVTVLEASDRAGGNVRTLREDGFVMDAGPDAWLAAKPEARALAEDVGLADDIIGTRADIGLRRVYVGWRGRLHAMPEGVVLGVPTRIAPMLTTRLFSLRGKARMALEPLVPRRRSAQDESVADFVARRLGREAVDRLAGPLLGGIFAGDAGRISVRAAFPQLVEQESTYGSLVMAMRNGMRKRPTTASAFLSFKQGMSAFPDALARGLDVRLSSPVRSLSHADGRFQVTLEKGAPIACDAVVIAASPPAAAALLAPLDDEAAATLRGIRCGSSLAVFLGYRRDDVAHPLDATGFVVAREKGDPLAAATFVTSKWEGRAPDGHVLLRAFLGGAGHEGAGPLGLVEKGDAELAAIARRELSALLGAMGEPVMTRVFRHRAASPQPEVGHLDLMKRVDDRLARFPGLYLAGNGYHGTGIPDCIKQARRVADAIAIASR